jgi:transmembrane sensor
MDELARRLSTLRGGVVPTWSEARSERLLAGAAKLRRRRHTRKIVTYAAAPLAAAAVLVVGLRASGLLSERTGGLAAAPGARDQAARNPLSAEPSGAAKSTPANGIASVSPSEGLRFGRSLRLADGSSVSVTSNAGELFVRRNERDDIDLRLAAGSAHFDVVPNVPRRFSVVAGSVEVIVVGTVFDVERVQGRVRVAVSHGKVEVRSAAGSALVEAGKSNWFDDSDSQLADDPRSSDSVSVESAATHEAASARKARAARTSRSGREEAARVEWRSLTQSGDHEGAYRLLEQGSPVGTDPEALMDAADAARLSNHPEAAAKYLRAVLKGPRGPTSPLAAFTLGRVLLERLGRPSEAADAFALARELAPQDSLAQDSLAREVEAWSKAGHSDKAYERARMYVDRYPDGRRLHVVQLYGGLRAQ